MVAGHDSWGATVNAQPITILVADDDEEDRMLMQAAWLESRLANDLRFVTDGQQLMDYLHRCGTYADADASPPPGLILLDLHMPRKSGREALAEIKADPRLRHIPVVILTSSNAEQDIAQSYELGVSSYITKPVSFADLVTVVKAVGHYWLEIVKLPTNTGRNGGKGDE